MSIYIVCHYINISFYMTSYHRYTVAIMHTYSALIYIYIYIYHLYCNISDKENRMGENQMA